MPEHGQVGERDPHAGELAQLLRSRGENVERADVEAEPLRWAQRARELTGATVLLKGAITNAVNFPSISAEEAPRIKPFVDLAEKLGPALVEARVAGALGPHLCIPFPALGPIPLRISAG